MQYLYLRWPTINPNYGFWYLPTSYPGSTIRIKFNPATKKVDCMIADILFLLHRFLANLMYIIIITIIPHVGKFWHEKKIVNLAIRKPFSNVLPTNYFLYNQL